MDQPKNSNDMLHYDVLDSVCKSLIYDVAQCISESELISLMPIALEGKLCRGNIAYEQLISLNKRDMLDYWQYVTSELQLKIKYNTLQALITKYASSKDPKWRPKLTDVEECVNKYRKNTLLKKEQKLEEGLYTLKCQLKKCEEEYLKQMKQFDEDIKLKFDQIRSILYDKIQHLDKIIIERQQQIDQLTANT